MLLPQAKVILYPRCTDRRIRYHAHEPACTRPDPDDHGAIAPEALGLTLPHEHIFIRMWEIAGRFDYAGQVLDEGLLAEEIAAFQELGGRSLVELTLGGLGRDPLRLRGFAERTGRRS